MSDTVAPGDAADTTDTAGSWTTEIWAIPFSSTTPHWESWDLQLIFALQHDLLSAFSALSKSSHSKTWLFMTQSRESLFSSMSGFCGFALVASYETQDFTRASLVSNTGEPVWSSSPNNELVNSMNTHRNYVTYVWLLFHTMINICNKSLVFP